MHMQILWRHIYLFHLTYESALLALIVVPKNEIYKVNNLLKDCLHGLLACLLCFDKVYHVNVPLVPLQLIVDRVQALMHEQTKRFQVHVLFLGEVLILDHRHEIVATHATLFEYIPCLFLSSHEFYGLKMYTHQYSTVLAAMEFYQCSVWHLREMQYRNSFLKDFRPVQWVVWSLFHYLHASS